MSVRDIVTLHLPMEMGAAGRIMKAVARDRANRERWAVRDRERRLRDPGAARERARRWRLSHPDRARQHRRRWLDDVPLREAAQRCAMTANRRARMYGVDGQIGYEAVLEVWRLQPVCVDCGEGRGLDHVIPLSRGGPNTSGNLANRCRSCNSVKGVRMPEVPA